MLVAFASFVATLALLVGVRALWRRWHPQPDPVQRSLFDDMLRKYYSAERVADLANMRRPNLASLAKASGAWSAEVPDWIVTRSRAIEPRLAAMSLRRLEQDHNRWHRLRDGVCHGGCEWLYDQNASIVGNTVDASDPRDYMLYLDSRGRLCKEPC